MASVPLPPFPSPKSELEQFLLSPENLPIHNFRNKQHSWSRISKPESLLSTSLCPTPIRISVTRDSATGVLLGYEEVRTEDVGLTPKNSTSLQRSHAHPSQAVEGESMNYPFWPGGMKLPSNVKQLIEEENNGEVDFENALLSVPPGFKDGMSFTDNTSATATTSVDEDALGKLLTDALSSHHGNGEESKSTDNNESTSSSTTVTNEESSEIDKLVEDAHPGLPDPAPLSGGSGGWAVRVDLSENVDDFYKRVPEMAHNYPFELDTFQKQAILRLEDSECVFVAAHTSAGKTAVAEYAIALSLSHMTKTLYTSPIKALSNQKFRDFRQTFGEDNIGLVTGDIQIKKEAPCLIMTTEILRSMLYHGADTIRDVEWVIFDEVHYVNDSERGVVWEEVMIMLPEHVKLILLSATVPNAMDFAEWVGHTKQKKMYVISTTHRPVPLQHYLYTGNSKQTQDQLYMIVDDKRKFIERGYKDAMESKKTNKAAGKSGAKGKPAYHPGNASQSKNVWLSLIYMLQKKDKTDDKDKLPMIAFTLSRKRCDEYADMLRSLDMTNGQEKHKINAFFQKSVSILKGSDRELPQVQWMKGLLMHGIAVHHSGILPIIKEVVEMLFGQGLVKILFATETFAMGVNMPARTVVFDSTEKHDGTRHRDLLPGEYVQMAGRAGRRGKDTTGTVIILCKGEVPESSALNKMILGTPTLLESKFRLTYTMLMNIMRVESLRVEDVMKRSFAELDSVKNEGDRRERLKTLLTEQKSLEVLNCYRCYEDIDQYYLSCVQITKLKKKLQGIAQPYILKELSPGRVIIVYTTKHQYALALILQEGPKYSKQPLYKCLMLCDNEPTNTLDLSGDGGMILPYQPMNRFYKPDGDPNHMVVDVPCDVIVGVAHGPASVNAKRILSDYSQRQLPRFKKNPPAAETVEGVKILSTLSDPSSKGLRILDPRRDLKVKDIDYVSTSDELSVVEETMNFYTCTSCPDFNEHLKHARKKAEIQRQLSSLTHTLSEDSLQLLPEYQQKVQVLKHYKFIDKDGTIQLKGRVACEIHVHEMMVTELLFRNKLAQFEPAEVAAILSCMVFQQKNCQDPELTSGLSNGRDMVLEMAHEIAEVERSYGIDTTPETYQEELRFGLMRVVYEWAHGEEFLKIINLTDVLEGVIVKCIQRLDELCRDIAKAARVVGDPRLGDLMREISTLIRRDIVFAASLYTI